MKPLVICLLVLVTLTPAVAQDLLGVGASSVRPLYEQMFDVYEQERNIEIAYRPDGSGAGRREILAQTVDFGASDAFLSDEQLASAPTDPLTGEPNRVLHIPMAVLAVVPTYNFEPIVENPEALRFSGPVLADIFLGNIIRWNDPAFQVLNPGVTLPDLPITVVTRADSSGTTSIFVDYLATVSEQWANEVSQGPQSSVSWPAGIGGQGSGEVADIVSATPGAITYVSLDFAFENNLGIGVMQNSSGNFVRPTADSLAEAANTNLPADLRATFTDTDTLGGWPIAGFTWLLVYQNQDYQGRTFERARATISLIRWMLSEGQRFHNDYSNGQIVGSARASALRLLDTVTYGDRSLPEQ
jgi:phosphate transport system substrate-binding protein